jgi:hypothetical protein
MHIRMRSPLLLIFIAATLAGCSTSPKPAQSALTSAQLADQEGYQDARQRALEDVLHTQGNGMR